MRETKKKRLQSLATPAFHVRLEEGRAQSVQYGPAKKPVEFVSPKLPFGDVNLTARQGAETAAVSTRGLAPARLDGAQGESEAAFAFDTLPGLSLALRFQLTEAGLSYGLRLQNMGDRPLFIENLSLPLAINNEFAWGVNATERVLRHSYVAGDNSFVYLTPCDGQPPYLLCMPQAGTRAEFYDVRADLPAEGEEGRGTYQLYLHARGEEAVAREKGCAWRQPVSGREIAPGETADYGFLFVWAQGYDGVRDALYAHGLLDIQLAPGMTVPRGHTARFAIRSQYPEVEIEAEYPAETTVRLLRTQGDVRLYEADFRRLGENKLTLSYGDGRESLLEFFITLPLRELIALRGAFIGSHQHRDPAKWYNGLLAEWNNETGVMLGPDNYDRIKGWRIYEVTCDDPGFSKPAFLAAKNAEYPVAAEVEALEYYVEHFVWGGLQRTEAEECAYGIYGIPDWHTLRNSEDLGPRGQMHIWRIYDYPHIALMYFMLYRIGRRAPEMLKTLSAREYLHRAYRTFLALYQYPPEIDDWSPYKTGLYNELVIAEVIEALKAEGELLSAQRLTFHWQRKAKFFVTACEDLFGSEYPFDTTGTESTHALGKWALDHGARRYEEDPRNQPDYTYGQALSFYRYQLACNIACRGVLENAYYLLGSDYRNCSAHYSLSYMSQMGGWSILEDALYRREDPAAHLRLGYASVLSSWALVNAGDAGSGYGYWFPGKQHNGAAGGGFENAPYGETWLEQPHHRGSWYYSCEIDLGFCGALRGAATILCEDPLLDIVAYGGRIEGNTVFLEDGVQRRFHHLMDGQRVHLLADNARMDRVELSAETGYRVYLEAVDEGAGCAIETHAPCRVFVDGTEMPQDGNNRVWASLAKGQASLAVRCAPH